MPTLIITLSTDRHSPLRLRQVAFFSEVSLHFVEIARFFRLILGRQVKA